MKKNAALLLSLLISVLCIAGIVVSAQGEIYSDQAYNALNDLPFVPFDTEEAEPDEPDVILEFHPTSAAAGSIIEVPLTMDCPVVVSTVHLFGLTYDSSVLSFEGFTSCDNMNRLSVSKDCFDNAEGTVFAELKTPGSLKGTVCKLRFKVLDSAFGKDTKVSMTAVIKENGKAVSSEIIPAVITVNAPLLGDLNGDKSVDIADALLLFMHSMLPQQYPISYAGNLDFDNNSSIDIGDAILLFMHSMLPDQYPIG